MLRTVGLLPGVAVSGDAGSPLPGAKFGRGGVTTPFHGHIVSFSRLPSRLTWGMGSATFAMNRRTKGGPVDHDLPLRRTNDRVAMSSASFPSATCGFMMESAFHTGGSALPIDEAYGWPMSS